MEIFIGLLVGLFAGFICGLFGMGGGSLMVPAIYHFFSDSFPFESRMKISIGTSLFVIIFSSISAIITYFKSKKINKNLLSVIIPSGILGSQVGAFLISKLDDRIVRNIFVVIVTSLGLKMFTTPEDGNKNFENIENYNKFIGILIGFISGFVSALCGVGGAVLIIPLLYIFLKIPIHYAIGTSLVSILFNSISGTIAYFIRNLVNLKIGIILSIASIIGAQIGSKFGLKIEKRKLKKSFSIILIISGFSVFFRS
ncbi:MAG: sulfite exporter TauE/SafE family protein [Candidatus Omnitrophica bacterium]|nr:sulfite exporter TauE/SafE family protein [Candidatus Omnitrophota bacterium]MCM8807736.1 sulfite exporter TauE/SafE family protein [Candidatus Omnitrophota bacterium]